MDRRIFLLSVGFVGAAFAVGVTAQAMLVLGVDALTVAGHELPAVVEVLIRISVNLATVAVIAGLALWLKVLNQSRSCFLIISVGIASIAAATRAGLQLLVGIYPPEDWGRTVGDALITMPVGLVILVTGGSLVEFSRRARTSERERLHAATRATEALAALQQEELRVRRDVADALHGTMQQRLVMIQAELAAIGTQIASLEDASAPTSLADRVRDVCTDLDALRERELRTLSVALYPDALDRGLVPAVRALTARIPASIPVEFRAEELSGPDGLDQGSRLLLVRVAEEGVSNALRHGRAESISLELRRDGGRCVLRVLHRGLAPAEGHRLNGLARLRQRLVDMEGGLDLLPRPHGAVLDAWLPIPEASTVPSPSSAPH